MVHGFSCRLGRSQRRMSQTCFLPDWVSPREPLSRLRMQRSRERDSPCSQQPPEVTHNGGWTVGHVPENFQTLPRVIWRIQNRQKKKKNFDEGGVGGVFKDFTRIWRSHGGENRSKPCQNITGAPRLHKTSADNTKGGGALRQRFSPKVLGFIDPTLASQHVLFADDRIWIPTMILIHFSRRPPDPVRRS